MKCLWITIKSSMIVSAMLGFASLSCAADKFDIGKNEYMTNCASCHGTAGKGDGPSAETLKSRVTDLTVLSRNNGGVFPVSRVYEVIDGRQQVKAHGVREMPVWEKTTASRVRSTMTTTPTTRRLLYADASSH